MSEPAAGVVRMSAGVFACFEFQQQQQQLIIGEFNVPVVA